MKLRPATMEDAERNGFVLAEDGPLQIWVRRAIMPAPS